MTALVVLRFEDTDGSTSIVDDTGRAWTAHGNAQIDTAQSKYGTGSLLVDGTGDYIDTPDSADFAFGGTGSYTIQGWIRPNDLSVLPQFISGQSTGDGSQQNLVVYISGGKIGAANYNGSLFGTCDSTTTLSTGTWYHFAWVKDGSDYRLYINGVLEASAFSATALSDLSNTYSIGRLGETAGFSHFNGWIDSYSIDSTALYSSDFTPSDIPYPITELTFVGYAPTVSIFGPFTPDAGALTFTGYAPNVIVPVVIAPSAGALAFTGQVPTVRIGHIAKPGVGAIGLTGYAPTIGRSIQFEINFTSFSEIENGITLSVPIYEEISKGITIAYGLMLEIQKGFEIAYPLMSVNVIERAITISYPLLNNNVNQVLFNPVAVIKGQNVVLDGVSISDGEGQYLWTCDIVLADIKDYGLFTADDVFTVDLMGEVYTFIVDSKSLDRNGMVDLSARVSGLSPGAIYTSPRANQVTKTWETPVTAYDAAVEVLAGGAVAWEILNWSIPAFRLGISNQTPSDILQLISKAAGGILVSEPDGSLRVRYLYPESVPSYYTIAPDQEYNDIDHNFTLREKTIISKIVNKLRVMDVVQSANQDIIAFTQDTVDPTKGVLHVWPQPWRTSISVEHTSNNRVSLALVGIETEDFTEVVEVVGGKGSVAHPIYQVLDVDWLYVNLTGIAFESDKSEFTSTHSTLKESLVSITYRTRYFKYNVRAFIDAQVQFVVRETGDTETSSSSTDIFVQRGSGNRRGEDVVDAVCCTIPTAVQRGRNELDSQASGLQDIEVEAVYRTGLRTGQVCEFYDMRTGEVWRGKITDIGHTAARVSKGNFELTTNLQVQKPTYFYEN